MKTSITVCDENKKEVFDEAIARRDLINLKVVSGSVVPDLVVSDSVGETGNSFLETEEKTVDEATVVMSDTDSPPPKKRAKRMVPDYNEVDVLCGYVLTDRHPGNVFFHELILSKVGEYMLSVKNTQKGLIITNTLKKILNNGTRFMRQDKRSQQWSVISPADATLWRQLFVIASENERRARSSCQTYQFWRHPLPKVVQRERRDSATLATRVTSTRHCNSFTRSQTFVPASWATVGIGGDISKSLTAVAKVLQETASLAVSPREVKQAVDAVTDRFSGYEQRDAHEFLSDLIDRVHDELEETEKGDEKENKEPNEAAVAEKNEKTAPPPTDEFSE
jgi:hypothetical protein